MRKLKIYVASSWRNTHQPGVVSALREAGHDVYDFRNPTPDDNGFSWREIDPDWQSWTVEQHAAAMQHPIAKRGYSYDKGALDEADLCVLVLPSGRSASWEFGYHFGLTRAPGIVYMPVQCEPELMYREAKIVGSIAQLLVAVIEFGGMPRFWARSSTENDFFGED